jgi:hypothetical protein
LVQDWKGLAIRFKQTPVLVGDLVSVNQLRMVPASAAVDFSFDFQDLVLKPVPDSAGQ